MDPQREGVSAASARPKTGHAQQREQTGIAEREGDRVLHSDRQLASSGRRCSPCDSACINFLQRRSSGPTMISRKYDVIQGRALFKDR
jgi:hypothetical protein